MEESSELSTTTIDAESLLIGGWKSILVENNRLYYVNEKEKLCCWIPPVECWKTRRSLPYGWEMARTIDGRRYYINHLEKETFKTLPVPEESLEFCLPPRTRTVFITRDAEIGFGFVAGSEKPVLIRSVAEDGPSANKLYANDQILKINGEDVRDMPQSDVILRIKQYSDELSLEVISNDDVQDVKNKGQKKSSIMSRATRERRRSNPVNVRFAESPELVQYIGSPPSIPLRRSSLPLIPNALKIFLENGQTRSFLYNPDTTIKEVFVSLCEKVGVKRMDRFSLVLESTQSPTDSYVLASELASQVYVRRNFSSSSWLCKLHLVIAPKDINIFLKEDPIAFEYFYRQMCSCVVEGRFGWEMKYDVAIKLAALHLQQYAMEDKVGKTGKVSVKAIEKEVGSLDTFVPLALVNTMQKKDLQRILAQQIKQTRNLCPPGQKYISPLQAKLQYLKICSEMKMYGGKQFNATVVDQDDEDLFIMVDQNLPSIIFVGPNVGLSHVVNHRSFTLNKVADFNQITGLVVTPHTDGKQNLKLFLTSGKSLTLIMTSIFETQDLVYLINGYCKQLADSSKPLSIIDMTSSGNLQSVSDDIPSYDNQHCVVPDTWSYNEQEDSEELKDLDLRQKPHFEGENMYQTISENKRPTNLHCNGVIKMRNSGTDVSPNLDRIPEEPCKEPAIPNGQPHFPETNNGPVTTRKTKVFLDDKDLDTESNDSLENSLGGKNRTLSNHILTKRDIPQVVLENEEHKLVEDNSQNTSAVHNGPTKIDIVVDENDTQDGAAKSPVDIKANEQGDGMKTSDVDSGSETRVVEVESKIDVRDDERKIPFNENLPIAVSTTKGDNSSHNTKNETDLKPEKTPVLPEIIDPVLDSKDPLSSNKFSITLDDEGAPNKNDVIVINDEVHNNANDPSIHNDDINMSQKRRHSSGYIDNLKEDHKDSSEGDNNYKVHNIKSRKEACDTALKNLYMHKGKVNSILHWNHSVRTNNDIVRTKRHSMIENVTILDECIHQIQLQNNGESKIIDVILTLHHSVGQLTNACTMLYNAQFSMRNFSSALIDVIEKFIDVLITTDAQGATEQSPINAEIHKDKCESVHFSLASLRKIITNL